MSPRFIIAALLGASAPLLAQTSANLSGIIVDTSGAPVAGATLKQEKQGLTATTRADGTVTQSNTTTQRHFVSGAGATPQEAGALRR
jgi:hypothetical protein